jgi:hypothetical protein
VRHAAPGNLLVDLATGVPKHGRQSPTCVAASVTPGLVPLVRVLVGRPRGHLPLACP